MKHTVRLKPKAQKSLAKLPADKRKLIFIVISRLADDPYIGKKLEGEYKGYYSIRAWPYRIIYTIYKNELLVIIIKIGHRQGIYK